jgi:hypothetical protein
MEAAHLISFLLFQKVHVQYLSRLTRSLNPANDAAASRAAASRCQLLLRIAWVKLLPIDCKSLATYFWINSTLIPGAFSPK